MAISWTSHHLVSLICEVTVSIFADAKSDLDL